MSHTGRTRRRTAGRGRFLIRTLARGHMDVFWTTGAERDRDAIFEYVTKENPAAATRLDEIFADVVATLADHPHLGRAEPIPEG